MGDLLPVHGADPSRHNAMVEKANARLEHLWRNNVKASARHCIYGVEISIEQASSKGRRYVRRSFEIIKF